MNDQQSQSQTTTTIDYECIPEHHHTISILDDDIKNAMEVLIGEYTGVIPKNYSIEHRRLSAYKFYPPLNAAQLRILAIENITSNEIKYEISEKVYKQLELIFQDIINNWTSILQTTAKKFISNTVENVIDSIREKLIDNQTTNTIIQRFILVNNLLKLV